MRLRAPSRIEIAGGIASGKTTLARALGSRKRDLRVIEERFRDNPYWAHFSEVPSAFALEKNAMFLAQHTGDIKAAGPGPLVCDYAVFQDIAYASLQQDSGHLTAIGTLYADLYGRLCPPALIVHLHCAEEKQLNRIRARGRPEEMSLRIDYLRALNKAIEELRGKVMSHVRVLEFSSDEVDFLGASPGATEIIGKILSSLSSD